MSPSQPEHAEQPSPAAGSAGSAGAAVSESFGSRFRLWWQGGATSDAWLRRLTWAGVVLPVAFIVCLQLVREPLFDRWWPNSGDVLVSLLTAAAAMGFGVVMFAIIGRGHREVVRRNRELAAVNDLLVLMAGDSAGDRVRTAAIDEARGLLRAQESGVAHRDAIPGSENAGDARAFVISSRLRGAGDEVLWVGRDEGPFDAADRSALDRLADLAALAQESDRLRDTERNAAIVNERLRISREMHDSLAQVLAVTHLRLRSLASRPDLPEQVTEQLTDMADTSEEAYKDVRETIHGLREAARDDQDCLETMRRYVAWFSRQSGIDASFDAAPCAVELSGNVAVHTLRVMQEALTNVRKHSGATAVSVTVGEAAPEVTLDGGTAVARMVVDDDGGGFDPRSVAPSEHYGLRSMRERAEAIGGKLVLESRRGRGTKVIMYIPCPAAGSRADAVGGHDRQEAVVDGVQSPVPGSGPGTEPAGRVRA